LEDDDDRGVSKAMSKKFSMEDRLPLLLIHGILHLVGYDHETDDDWIAMTNREDVVLSQLRSVLK
jgi:rRNA maturation RNase YbeY